MTLGKRFVGGQPSVLGLRDNILYGHDLQPMLKLRALRSTAI